MLSFRIALRFLSSSKGQTALIAIGIAIAISVQIFVGILIMSLQKGLLDNTVGRSPHITVLSAEENITFDGYQSMVTEIESIEGVDVVSLSVDTNCFILKGNRTEPGLVRGFDLQRAEGIYRIKDAIYEGRSPGDKEVLIGKELAQTLNAQVGNVLTVTTPLGGKTNVTISGLFDLEVASLNKAWVISDLSTARGIFGYGDVVTAIEVKLKDPFAADTVAKKIRERLADPTLEVSDWKTQNQQLLSALESQTASSNMIQGFILMSVIIAIASILAITVLQKSRQIGILKAMGIKDREASLIFLFQGVLLGFLGSFLGILIGVGLLTSFLTFVKGSDGNPLIMLYIDPVFLLQSWVIAMLSSTLAGVVPAQRSSKLNPIEVIRNG